MDLPIYRCTNEEYKREQRQRSLRATHAALPTIGQPDTRDARSTNSDREPADQWRYNEILGWLRLLARGGVVCGDLYLSKAKRMSGRQKRMFKRLTRAFEIDLDGRASNEEISSQIFVELESLADRPPVRDRFLDLSVLRNLAPFLNWRRLFSME